MATAALDAPLDNKNQTWPAGDISKPTDGTPPGGWVMIQFQEASGQYAFQGLQGFIPYLYVDGNEKTANHLWDLNHAYPTCGGKPADYPGHLKRASTLTESFGNPDEWFGNSSQLHFQMDRQQEIPAVPGNEGMLFDSTSDTRAGDIVRSIVPQGTAFTEFDTMNYEDPNDFCWNPSWGSWGTTRQQEYSTTWRFGELNPGGDANHLMIGWIPYRDAGAAKCS